MNPESLALEEQKKALMEILIKERSLQGTPDMEKIIPRDKNLPAPLSYSQQRLWFVDQLDPGNAAYNVVQVVEFPGELNVSALQFAFGEFVMRHDVLRTVFHPGEKEPFQTVLPWDDQMQISLMDLSDLGAAKTAAEQILSQSAERRFDLLRGPLFQFSILRLNRKSHALLFVRHHIISDWWSNTIFHHELMTLYQGYLRGQPQPLPPLPIQYADFAVWQKSARRQPILQQQGNYWRKKLSGAPTILNLPVDWPRPVVLSHRGSAKKFRIPSELMNELRALSDTAGATLFMGMLAAYEAFLFYICRQEQFLVGTGIANRNRKEIEGLVGFFMNTLVVRSEFTEDTSFLDLLKKVRADMLEAFANQDYPFERLVEDLDPPRLTNYTPLVQVGFVMTSNGFNSTRSSPEARAPIAMDQLKLEHVTAKLDLALFVIENNDGADGAWEYRNEIFARPTIERFTEYFVKLLREVVRHPSRIVQELDLLSISEREQLLVEWNATEAAYPQQRRVHECVEQQAERDAEAVALISGDRRLTYGELNQRANQLGHYLRRLGVGPEVLVGICMERSVEMVVALLGVLKAGGAYVPIEPQDPLERLELILKDVRTGILLTQENLRERFSAMESIRVLSVDTQWESLATERKDNPATRTYTENLAYAIYTSGSGGRPKGVEITHGGLSNLICWHQVNYGIVPGDRATLVASVAFDASVWELWPYLAAGATVCIPAAEIRDTPVTLRDWLVENGITISFVPTPLAEPLLAIEWPDRISLRALLTGGDRLKNFLSRAYPFEVVNHYGPTENTVVTSCARVPVRRDAASSPPIGRPIGNTKIYLLSTRGQPVPVGVRAELHVGGAGLARGYLGRPDLTAEKFVPDEFANEAGGRLYRTGDWARSLPDGNIEFLERLDRQVKLRGYRIEVGEIESILRQHPAVKECIVLLREDQPGEKSLVGYVAPRDGQSVISEELMANLKRSLPQYMCPETILILKSLPLTLNGKVDRKALPAPERASSRKPYVAPSGPVEETIAQIWQSVLKVERVGVHDNFFELGGHSILATRVISRMRGAFGVELRLLRKLFETPTIAELSPIISWNLKKREISNSPVAGQDEGRL